MTTHRRQTPPCQNAHLRAALRAWRMVVLATQTPRTRVLPDHLSTSERDISFRVEPDVGGKNSCSTVGSTARRCRPRKRHVRGTRQGRWFQHDRRLCCYQGKTNPFAIRIPRHHIVTVAARPTKIINTVPASDMARFLPDSRGGPKTRLEKCPKKIPSSLITVKDGSIRD